MTKTTLKAARTMGACALTMGIVAAVIMAAVNSCSKAEVKVPATCICTDGPGGNVFYEGLPNGDQTCEQYASALTAYTPNAVCTEKK